LGHNPWARSLANLWPSPLSDEENDASAAASPPPRTRRRRRAPSVVEIPSDDDEGDRPYLSSQTKTDAEKDSDLEITEFSLTTPPKKRKTIPTPNRASTLSHAPAFSTRRPPSYNLGAAQADYNPLPGPAAGVVPNPTAFHPPRNHVLSASQGQILYRAVRAFQHYYDLGRRYGPVGIVRSSSNPNVFLPIFAQTTNAQGNTMVLFRQIWMDHADHHTRPRGASEVERLAGDAGVFMLHWMRSTGAITQNEDSASSVVRNRITPDVVQDWVTAWTEFAINADLPALRRSYVTYYTAQATSSAGGSARPQAEGSLSLERRVRPARSGGSGTEGNSGGSGGGVARGVPARRRRENDDDEEEESEEFGGVGPYGRGTRRS